MSIGLYLGAGASVTQGLYRLENVNDSSGNARNLTNNGTVTFTSGKFGNAANLGATNSTKRLTYASNMGCTGGAYTIGVWVKLLAQPGEGATYSFVNITNDTTDLSYRLDYAKISGTYYLIYARGRINVAEANVYTTGEMGTTNWFQMMSSYDGSTMSAYLNGNLVASGTLTGSGSGTTANLFTIGANQVAGNYASSLLDEVILENRVWTASQVRKYYTHASGKFMGTTGI